MNTFLNELKEQENYGVTENGAIKHNSTLNAVLDMFALGGAFRSRSDDECIDLFGKAFDENPEFALKCLFYLRDCREGQGERRFFRVCFQWLANFYPDAAKRNLPYIAEYGRFDDILYTCIDTPIENDALNIIKEQLAKDVQSGTPSLLGKWLPSTNASSPITKAIANKVRRYLGMTHRQYRKTLSILRSRINVLEKLMSEGRWGEIDFGGIPSKAGINYRNAFATREETKDRYKAFLDSKDVKVNTSVLTPVDIVHKAMDHRRDHEMIERKALDQYWKDLPDYYGDTVENGLAIVDVSGSMWGLPMEAAIGLGAYIAERGHGPFANHFITFSQYPELVKFHGADIVAKVNNCQNAAWGYNTNIEAVFDLLLRTAKSENTKPEDMPTRLYIFSDQEFDRGLNVEENNLMTLIEAIEQKWKIYGYDLPDIVFWNLDARHNSIPGLGKKFSYISGYSPSMIQAVLTGKNSWDLCLEVLLSKRYEPITV